MANVMAYCCPLFGCQMFPLRSSVWFLSLPRGNDTRIMFSLVDPDQKKGFVTRSDATFSVSVPPTIRPDPADGNYVVKKGRKVELKCVASGNPDPTITWTRQVG